MRSPLNLEPYTRQADKIIKPFLSLSLPLSFSLVTTWMTWNLYANLIKILDDYLIKFVLWSEIRTKSIFQERSCENQFV